MANENFNNILLLKGFNNYFNRTVINYETVEEYISESESYKYTNSLNFNPNNGLNTTIILNISEDEAKSDYLLVLKPETSSQIIESKWFIIDVARLRNNQYKLELRKDVVAENINSLADAPIYVEKAIIKKDNPLICNSENMIFNQIKKEETLLKDESNSAWLVAYIADNTNFSNKEVKANFSVNTSNYIDEEDLPIPLKEEADVFDKMEFRTSYFTLRCKTIGIYGIKTTEHFWIDTTINDNTFSNCTYSLFSDYAERFDGIFGLYSNDAIGYVYEITNNNRTEREQGISNIIYNRKNQFKNIINHNNINSNITEEEINSYIGKIIKDSEDKYYRITNVKKSNIKKLFNEQQLGIIPSGISNELCDSFLENSTNYFKQHVQRRSIASTVDNQDIYYNISYYTYQFELEELIIEEAVLKFPELDDDTKLKHLLDAPYYCIAMPYGNIHLQQANINTNKEAALAIAEALPSSLGTASIYDIQLVPYCPVRHFIDGTGIINEIYGDATENIDNIYIKDSQNNIISIALIADESKFSFSIPMEKTIPQIYEDENINYKIANECDFYRLASPNFNGQFQFNLAKNNGSIEFLNIDVTYKPFQPYIHIIPNLKGLYGSNFNDARGLICGGDFSINYVSSSWTDYQVQNKNFQQIFDREIQNMEFKNTLNNIKGISNAITGVAQGAITGAIVGGVGGAVAGAGASAIGGAADMGLQIASQKEQRSFATDMYNFQLGNIQAMPYSLSKTTAYTNNNKIFPILEFYTCTDEEKEILKNKIKYDGMTIMAISTLSDIVNSSSFIKGELIRGYSFVNDSNVFDACYNEFKKGLYLTKE